MWGLLRLLRGLWAGCQSDPLGGLRPPLELERLLLRACLPGGRPAVLSEEGSCVFLLGRWLGGRLGTAKLAGVGWAGVVPALGGGPACGSPKAATGRLGAPVQQMGGWQPAQAAVEGGGCGWVWRCGPRGLLGGQWALGWPGIAGQDGGRHISNTALLRNRCKPGERNLDPCGLPGRW